jgi:hypothetical protein
MQQHWQTKKQICNFKHTEEKQNSLPSEKNKINSALKTSKIKQNKTTQRFVFLLRLVPFLGLVHFLYCTYSTYMWNKVSWKCPWGSPISWNFSGSFWTESFTIYKEFHESKFCESWMLIKKYFVSITWVFAFYFKTVILSWNFWNDWFFCL